MTLHLLSQPSYPTLLVTATPSGNQWLLSFPCPWCPPCRGRSIRHEHPGGPFDQPPADGWRTSHCPRRGKEGTPFAYTMMVRVGDADPPQVETVAEWSKRDRYWALTVLLCPFCGKRHHHGGCSGEEPSFGSRAAHCLTGAGGSYELVPILGAAPPKSSDISRRESPTGTEAAS